MIDGSDRTEYRENVRGDTLFTILESMDEVIYVSDPETYELLYLNPAGARHWGDRTGEKCYRVLQGREEPCPFCTNRLIFAENAELPHIWVFQNQVNRHWYKCTDRTIRWKDGRLVRFEMAVDITDRMEAEEALRESERRFRSFMDQLPAAVFLKDSSGRYVYINPYMREVFDADDSWIGRHTSECFSDREAESLTSDDRDALESNYSVNVQKVVDSLGRDRLFQTHKFRISRGGKGGDLLGGIALDVTERVSAENARKKMESQIQHTQKLESLGVLAGGIAHDFNNILMAILGYADLALLDTDPSSSARESIGEIERAARNAADLTRQMLAYSGRGKFQITKLDLNVIIREMTHLLEISISKKAVIKYDLVRDLPPIEADPSQIRQIIMNLITNASDAMEDTSGVITITTNVMECDREYLRTAYISGQVQEGTYVYMEVSDTGCGMDERTLRRLFDPFFTTKFTGRGLGLSAVLGIVRGHGGTVKVYSEEGKGSSFKVLLPAVGGEAEPGPPPDVCDLEDPYGGTILMVDDEPSVREVGRSMLERKGFSVILAGDGREALEIYKEMQDDIDCVILDLTMPHMDGDETFREMRKVDSKVKVIISSGYNKQDVTQRFVGKGLAGFIQKPYRLNELHAKLQEVMEEKEDRT